MPTKYYLEHREELLPILRENSKRYYERNREKVKARVLSRYVPTGRPRGRPKKIVIKMDNETPYIQHNITCDESTSSD